MKIYFAGSIRGGRDDAKIYYQIIEHLKNHAEVLTEHIGNTSLPIKGENLPMGQVHDRDMSWVFESNLVVAEVSTPSIGVGYEIGRAIEKNIPVLCLYKKGSPKQVSGMIEGSNKLTLIQYETLEEVQDKINNFFNHFSL
jgi:2'-deoxynucleoside 5'-phosphate N-hydrolase